MQGTGTSLAQTLFKKEEQKGKREKGERGKRKQRGRTGGKRRAYVLIISCPFLLSKGFRPYNASLGAAPDCILSTKVPASLQLVGM